MSKFAVEESYPACDFDDHWAGLSLEEAAARMDDLTGVGADVILSDFDEGCMACDGTGKRSEPWEWTDEETEREAVMRRERDQ